MHQESPIKNQTFISLICAISLDPKSWSNWRALDISIDVSDDPDENEVSLLCAKSLVESYLKDQVFHVFLCPPHTLYVLSKTVSTAALEEVSAFIVDMIREESDQCVACQIYHFDTDIEAFLTKVQDDGDVGPVRISPHLHGNIAPFPISKNTKALLVEDDPVTRWMVRSSLKEECHLATASSASAAYAIYSSFRPDIVFLDIGLPDKSGHDVLEWILRNDPGAQIVMFSSEDSLETMTHALELGAIGFIAKPFRRENLLHYLHLKGKSADHDEVHASSL